MNVILVPAAMIYLALLAENALGLLSALAMIPMMLLLLIGGMYWRGKYLRLQGQKAQLETALSLANRLQVPALSLTALAIAGMIYGWMTEGAFLSTGDKVVTTISAVLALLEYINYFHRQLQHFDHKEDFKRLLSGRGFRPAQMNVDLRRWRQRQSQQS